MERELQYPDFLTPEGKRKEQIEKKIEKLKIYRKTLGLLALGVGIGLAAPKVNATVKDAVRISIERDNERFHEEAERHRDYVLNTTGMTTEEIMARGKDQNMMIKKQKNLKKKEKEKKNV